MVFQGLNFCDETKQGDHYGICTLVTTLSLMRLLKSPPTKHANILGCSVTNTPFRKLAIHLYCWLFNLVFMPLLELQCS